MKKFLVTILAILYIGITSGIVLNIHYCMGERSSVNYGVDDQDNCGKCGMEDKQGCCHTEHQLYKVQDEHLFSKMLPQFGHSFISLTADNLHDSYAIVFPCDIHAISGNQHSPPDQRANFLRLYNGVFRI